MPVTLTIHESQYPTQVSEQLCHGLRTRALSGKFLYDSPAQAQRWLAYHQAYSPSRTESALVVRYQQAFGAALQQLSAAPLHYISLGCGGGTKDLLFLQQASIRQPPLGFTPTDVSPALIVETMCKVQSAFPTLPSFPLVIDLEAGPDFAALLAQPETPDTQRLFTCFGMLPNFAYQTFLPYLHRLMRPDDLLLLSANLSPHPYPEACLHIVPQYDNPLAHTWYTGLLDSLGFVTTDYAMHVEAHALHTDGQIWQMRAVAQFVRDIHLRVYDEAFSFAAGERLQLFFSTRFTPPIMPHILQGAGLTVVDTFLFASQEEGIYLCRRSPEIPRPSHEEIGARNVPRRLG
jgi:uncharacterized SAM-dependent methyltransferase